MEPYTNTYNLQYASIPLTFNYTIPVSRFGFYGRAGGYFSYAIAGKYNKNNINFSKDKVSKIDLGVLIGAGCKMELAQGFLFLEAMYMLGLHKLDTSETFDPNNTQQQFEVLYKSAQNRGLMVTAGYVFALGKK